jgi:hypothetical protein
LLKLSIIASIPKCDFLFNFCGPAITSGDCDGSAITPPNQIEPEATALFPFALVNTYQAKSMNKVEGRKEYRPVRSLLRTEKNAATWWSTIHASNVLKSDKSGEVPAEMKIEREVEAERRASLPIPRKFGKFSRVKRDLTFKERD